MKLDYTLRQKTWGIFIKPYVVRGNENMVIRGTLMCSDPFSGSGYVLVKGGDAWMLYKVCTAFSEAREIVKEIMDELGISMHDITVVEIIPTDHIVTPLT